MNIDDAVLYLHQGKPLKAVLTVLLPWFKGSRDYSAEQNAATWIMTWITSNGNPYGSNQVLDRELRGIVRQLDGNLPNRRISPSLSGVRRSELLPEVPEDLAPEDRSSMEIEFTNQVARQLHVPMLELLNHAIKHRKWQSKDLFATIDGRKRPFYGIGSNQTSIDEDYVHRLSIAGRLTCPGVKSKKLDIGDKIAKASIQESKGTWRAHEWLHLTIHHVVTGESFPLAILHRNTTHEKQMMLLVEALEGLYRNPAVILVDKEFTGAYERLAVLRDYADPRGIYIIGPQKRYANVALAMREAWTSGEAQVLPEADELLYFAEEVYQSDNDPKKQHTIGFVYTKDEFRSDIASEMTVAVVTPTGAEIPIRGIAFYSNLPVPRVNAHWFCYIYARRWACESLFMRHGALMGRSQGQTMMKRHFGYAGAFLILSIYAYWRSIERSRLRLRKQWPPQLSHREFFADLSGDLKGAFLRDVIAQPPPA